MDFAALESMPYHLGKSAPRKTRDKSTRWRTATAGVILLESEPEPLSRISAAGPVEGTVLQGEEVFALDAQPWGQYPGSDFSLGSQTSIPSRGWRSPSASVGPGPVMNSRPMSARPPRNQPFTRENPACYLCLGKGHFVSTCPLLGSLPPDVITRIREARL